MLRVLAPETERAHAASAPEVNVLAAPLRPARDSVSVSRRRGPRHAREPIGLALLGGGLLLLLGRVVVPGVIGLQRDTGAFYYPLTAWFAQELQAGRYPLWCPLIFGGYPLFADGEIGMLYPPNLLALVVLPTELAFAVVQAAHYLVAAGGTYALARVLGVGRAGAAYAGVAFALGGFMVGHLDHGNILRSAAWLPALLCCGELALRAADRRAVAWAALGAAALGLAGLGLHVQIVMIDLVAFWSFLLLRVLAFGTRSVPVRPLLLLGGATLLGLGAAAIQLVPLYELAQFSSRGEGLPYANAVAGAISPYDLAMLVFPFIFRTEVGQVWWSLNPLWETTTYVGAVGLVLALVGLILAPVRVSVPLLGLTLIGLALAMADHFPVNVHEQLWKLPGFGSMRAPGRFRIMVELGLALLAGVGLHYLFVVDARRARRALLAAGAVVLGLLAGLVALRTWVASDPAGALAAIERDYLSLRHDRSTLTAEQVRQGLLHALDPANAWTVLGVGALVLAVALLWARCRWPAAGRWWRGGLVVAATVELLLVAHSFHPTLPIDALEDPSGPLRFLSDRPGIWRAFIAGRSDSAVTSRPALFGIAQTHGYSSLPSVRAERYWTRVNEVDDELLDLWNGRYLVEQSPATGLMAVDGVRFNPERPLVFGPADSPLGHEAFRVAPTATDSLRVLTMAGGAGHLPDGTAVAELTIFGGESPPETVTLRLGTHTAEGAYDDPSAGLTPAHARAAIGHRWEPRDPAGRVYPRNWYLADVALATPRTVDRVEVRTVVPDGDFRLAGLALVDRASGGVAALTGAHRDKYSLAYEDARTRIYENRDAFPPAFVVEEAVVVRPDDWALVHLVRPGFDPRRQVLVEAADAGGKASRDGEERAFSASSSAEADAAPAFRPEDAAIEEHGSDRVVIRARAPRGGYLVLTDAYYPGWKARLDGRELPIERANYLFRAVRVPPGEHTVVFSFEPASVMAGQIVSVAAWLAILVLVVSGLRRASSVQPPDRTARMRRGSSASWSASAK